MKQSKLLEALVRKQRRELADLRREKRLRQNVMDNTMSIPSKGYAEFLRSQVAKDELTVKDMNYLLNPPHGI